VSCKKCNSDAVVTKYIESGKLIDSSSLQRVENDFIFSIESVIYFSLKAKKEHLYKHCSNCGYEWRENTTDNT